MAMWAKREWSGLQGLTQEEQAMMDVSDLGNGQTAGDGIPLGEGWLLQLAGVDVSGRRKSLGLSKKNEGEVLRDFGLPLLLHSEEGRRWHEALASLPTDTPRPRRTASFQPPFNRIFRAFCGHRHGFLNCHLSPDVS